MSEEQKLQLPRLVDRLQSECWRGRLSEGVKYVVHCAFDEDMPEWAAKKLAEELEADGFYTGKIFGKPQVVFFFMPLFE